jgi:hypothetical protein
LYALVGGNEEREEEKNGRERESYTVSPWPTEPTDGEVVIPIS